MTLWWCWGLLSTAKPSLFPADPDQLPQSLLMGKVLQPYHPGSPPLSSLQFVHAFPVPGPKTGLSISMWREKCHTERDNPFPLPLSYTPGHTVQKLLAAFAVTAHLSGVQLIALYDLGAPLQHCRAAPQPHPLTVLLRGIIISRCQGHICIKKKCFRTFWVYNFNYFCEQIMKMFLPSLKKSSNIFFKQQSFSSLWDSGNAFCHLLKKKALIVTKLSVKNWRLQKVEG